MAVLVALLLSRYVVSVTFIHGPSMEDTLRDGRVVLLWRMAGEIKTGDIVVTDKNNPFDEILVKRVIATGGQHLVIGDGRVWVDGELLREDYLKDPDWNGEILDLVIPEDCVFLMGDNRDFSRDSREIGCVPRSDLLGKVIP